MTVQSNSPAAEAAFSSLAHLALARSRVFGLLAVAFFDPTAELVDQLLSGSFVSELHGYYDDLTARQLPARAAVEGLVDFQASLAEVDPSVLLKELKVEYARLFIGPGKPVVPPYETSYGPRFEGVKPLLMVSPEAVAVETAYREAGVAVSDELREPPDHFATEAEFLYYLCQKESDAWAEGEHGTARKWRRRQLAFIDGHLGVWGRLFCQDVAQHSRHPFYRAAAGLAGTFLQLEGSDGTEP